MSEKRVNKYKIVKTATKYMEVHHHPQAEKKNFKEYCLEFFMIFLASNDEIFFRRQCQ